MPVLKIVGYETGKKKFELREILVDRLGLEGKEAEKMRDAIVDGRAVTLNIDDEEVAVGLGQELVEAGAKVELTT
ncbi:MAG: hypothetical protein OEM82_00540 [Acidobacteriota bacterium]|nr:hypothetical protein [Acidobacteriota bacterium]MDH3528101.1 hypothetical protein [Acidobacteriota bacterium]